MCTAMVTPSHPNNCLLSLQRDPSETVSVKDVLARAAAKGLLEGVEVGKALKRDKKRKKSKALPPRAPHHGDPLRDHLAADGNDTSNVQMKISELLHRESKISTSTKMSVPAKTVSQVGTSSQVRKPSKPLSTPLVRNFSRPVERPTNSLRARPEGKVIPLKPIEIALPPMIFPLSSQGPRAQTPATHVYYRFVGSKVGVPRYLTSSTSRRKDKVKESSTPSSHVRHPRPWL